MKSMNLTPLIGALILTVLICAGLWFYTQWDLKRFDETLPKLPPVEAPREDAVQPQAGPPQGSTDPPEPAKGDISDLEPEVEHLENERAEITEAATMDETQTSYDVSHAWLSAEYHEDTEEASLTSGDDTNVTQELPYDIEVVKVGFDDYNAFLATDPEYAYQRLDDALREQFGDDSDVDILVEYTRQVNNGPVTMDSIAENLEAQLRLLVKNNYPGQQELQESLESHRELEQMALELGAEIKLTHRGIRIDTSRD